MKKLRSKIPAMIAMFLALFTFGFMIAMFISDLFSPPVEFEGGIGFGFACWIYGMAIAVHSLVFYFFDALLTLHKATLKIDPVFNTIVGTSLLVAIALLIILSRGVLLMVILWNVIFLAIFVLEIISICRQLKKV